MRGPLKTFSEEPVERRYWTIGQVSKELNEAPSLVRFWMREFQIEVKRTKNRRFRLFNAKDKQLMKDIYFLVKVEGYKLAAARRKLEGHL